MDAKPISLAQDARQKLSAFSDGAVQAPPFVLIEPLRKAGPVVFASPHSGRCYPGAMLCRSRLDLHTLRRAEDAYVDALFSAAPSLGAPLLCANIARAYVDLNRHAQELDVDMFAGPLALPAKAASGRVQAGLGVIPRIAGDGREIYAAKLCPSEAEERLAQVYRPYHAALEALLAATQEQFGCALLMDCHSMPSTVRGPNAPDIVLGDRFGASAKPGLTARVEGLLRHLGYRVARNAPFAGGHITEIYGQPKRGRYAIQLELCRGLYMNETSLEPSADFASVRADMGRLIAALLEEPMP